MVYFRSERLRLTVETCHLPVDISEWAGLNEVDYVEKLALDSPLLTVPSQILIQCK